MLLLGGATKKLIKHTLRSSVYFNKAKEQQNKDRFWEIIYEGKEEKQKTNNRESD